MKNDLNRLQLHCKNREYGCEMICSLESIDRHERECEYSQIRCSNAGEWHSKKLNPLYSENMCLSPFSQQKDDNGCYFQTENQSFGLIYSLQQSFWTKSITNLWQLCSLATFFNPRTNQNELVWWTSNFWKYRSVFVLLSVKLWGCLSMLAAHFDASIKSQHLQNTSASHFIDKTSSTCCMCSRSLCLVVLIKKYIGNKNCFKLNYG